MLPRTRVARPMAPARDHGAIAPRGPPKKGKQVKSKVSDLKKKSKTHQITHESTILISDSEPARNVDIDRGA